MCMCWGSLLLILFTSVSEFTSWDILTGRKDLFSKGFPGKVELQEAGHPESGSGRCMELRLCQLRISFVFLCFFF